MTLYRAVNWNKTDDNFTQMFWEQNVQQMWVDTEFDLEPDKMSWLDLEKTEQEVYKRVLGGLTLLDTIQGGVGMPQILEKVEGLQRKSVLGFMGMMEQIHAKSYSTIFTTVASNKEIDEVFEWVEQNKYLQKKAKIIDEYYSNIKTKRDLFMAMAASAFLENTLFFSGFFYPLYLAGQGKMLASGEIIQKIIQDEQIHSVYIGLLAQEMYKDMNKREQQRNKDEVYELLEELYANEVLYAEELYSPIGLQEEVKKFIRYNANKTLQNLGFDIHFPEEEVNSIVMNGIKTDTRQHDFFNSKGNSYVIAAKVELMNDEDFKFDF